MIGYERDSDCVTSWAQEHFVIQLLVISVLLGVLCLFVSFFMQHPNFFGNGATVKSLVHLKT